MPDAPKVFISHASEDMSSYAKPLAEALRKKGVDAWFDKWEIRYGDSLVQRIFEQGLKRAATFVYLMSANSVDKPWVRAELENAVTQLIDGTIRLIPVKLDDCNVPNSVKSILWIDLAKAGSIANVADEIAKEVFGYSDKPALGPTPPWVDANALRIDGLDKQDEVVLSLIFQGALNQRSRNLIKTSDLKQPAEDHGISNTALHESVRVLIEQGYIESGPIIAKTIFSVNIKAGAFVELAELYKLPVAACELDLASILFNENKGRIEYIHERLQNYPKALVDALLDRHAEQGWIKVARALGGGGEVSNPSVTYKRWFRDASG